ncbi:NAD(P)-dependent oxidoreductase [Erysipelothrix urinaevulpis]|uniref:NAD-dependent epimerase/dehydratase family protein n=1 Tax=Erysipelothrix urinaevulpis TaxID=2683717 RepID=UPI0013584593|nr:NAD(P)-dependent oxidoreductase [Erysipelothrix urinaevulpis]
MKTLVIGGTGLLGSEIARQLIEKGHEVTGLALPPVPTGAPIPQEMKLEFANYIEMSDDEMANVLKGMDGVVFAAGVDERIPGPSPIYDFFKKYNIDAMERVLRISKEVGVKHAVVLGSYFTAMDRKFPEFELTKWHPYIRSRVDQLNLAISMADENFDVSVVELPYIFGSQPGRKPVWTLLVDSVNATPDATYYTGGGTTMVTVRQVGQACVGALEKNKGGNYYPLGYFNLTFTEMMAIVHEAMGLKGRPVVTITPEQYLASVEPAQKELEAQGLDQGLHMVKFVDLQFSNMFIEKEEAADFLGVTDDDIESAITDSIKASLAALEHADDVLDMKVE